MGGSTKTPATRVVGRDALAGGDLVLGVLLALARVHVDHHLGDALFLVAALRVLGEVAGVVHALRELVVAKLLRRAADHAAGLALLAARVDGRLLLPAGVEHVHAPAAHGVAAALGLELQRPLRHGLLALGALERHALAGQAART